MGLLWEKEGGTTSLAQDICQLLQLALQLQTDDGE
jgi:hypothetical protein